LRVTNATGLATGVTLLRRGEEVWLAWSDARSNAAQGFADVYFARLSAADGSLVAPEQRLETSSEHSHSVQLEVFGKGAVMAWLQSGQPRGDGVARSRVSVAELDQSGKYVRPPVSADLGQRSPSGLVLNCGAGRCSVVAGGSAGDRSQLIGFEWSGSEPPQPHHLVSLSGPAGQDVVMTRTGNTIFFTDQLSAESARLYQLVVR
jgi:hypothetical protein